MKKSCVGRPKIEFSKKQKELANLYVKTTGYCKQALADYFGIDKDTLSRILKEDNNFSTALLRANSEFRGKIIESVMVKNPTFLLKTKFKDEFGDEPEDEQKTKKQIDSFFNGVRSLMKK